MNRSNRQNVVQDSVRGRADLHDEFIYARALPVAGTQKDAEARAQGTFTAVYKRNRALAVVVLYEWAVCSPQRRKAGKMFASHGP